MSDVKKAKPSSAKKEDNPEAINAPVVFDQRIAYFEERVLGVLKIKADKWKKLVATPECK